MSWLAVSLAHAVEVRKRRQIHLFGVTLDPTRTTCNYKEAVGVCWWLVGCTCVGAIPRVPIIKRQQGRRGSMHTNSLHCHFCEKALATLSGKQCRPHGTLCPRLAAWRCLLRWRGQQKKNHLPFFGKALCIKLTKINSTR